MHDERCPEVPNLWGMYTSIGISFFSSLQLITQSLWRDDNGVARILMRTAQSSGTIWQTNEAGLTSTQNTTTHNILPQHSTLPQYSRTTPYNHTISRHVSMPKQPSSAAAPRPPNPVFTPFAPPVKAEMVGPLLMEPVALGRLFV